MDQFFHLPADGDAAAGIVIDQDRKDQQMALFSDQVAAERCYAGKAAGLGIYKGAVLAIIRGKGAGAACWKNTLQPWQAEFLLQLIQYPDKILRREKIVAAEP